MSEDRYTDLDGMFFVWRSIDGEVKEMSLQDIQAWNTHQLEAEQFAIPTDQWGPATSANEATARAVYGEPLPPFDPTVERMWQPWLSARPGRLARFWRWYVDAGRRALFGWLDFLQGGD